MKPYYVLPLILLLLTAPSLAEDAAWDGKKSNFHSFDKWNFNVDGASCQVVVPKKAAEGNPWIWRARFFGHEPQFDIAMLEKGYHVAYVNVGGLFGGPEAMARGEKLYNFLTEKKGFNKKPVLEGMSRGGLFILNWAANHPDSVVAIYADAPVCNFASWPAGAAQGKKANGSASCWKQCLDAHKLTNENAAASKTNPINNLEPIAKAKIPILCVVGDADKVVPVAENTAVLKERLEKLGHTIEVIHKPGVGHHPHSLKDPKPIVDFVLKATK